MQSTISAEKCFATTVIPRELDDRARLMAARLKMTRSRLMALALAEFVEKTESNSASVEVSRHGRQ